MWRNRLWKTGGLKFSPQCLLKTSTYSHLPCGEKSVAGLEKKGVFHISLYYGYYYYLNLFIESIL